MDQQRRLLNDPEYRKALRGQQRSMIEFAFRTILLEVRRKKDSMDFEDVGRESFWRYEGGWEVAQTPGGVRVSYHLIAQPDFVAPSMLMSRALKRGARELLGQVRAEMVRRSDPGRTRP